MIKWNKVTSYCNLDLESHWSFVIEQNHFNILLLLLVETSLAAFENNFYFMLGQTCWEYLGTSLQAFVTVVDEKKYHFANHLNVLVLMFSICGTDTHFYKYCMDGIDTFGIVLSSTDSPTLDQFCNNVK